MMTTPKNPTDPVSTFGENLRDARLEAGLTQDDLSRILEFKRATPISIWERSPDVPDPKSIIKLAKALKCAPARLLRGVVTEYDKLRSYTLQLSHTEAAAMIAGLDADPELQHWANLGSLLGVQVRRRHAALIEALLVEQGVKLHRGADARLESSAASARTRPRTNQANAAAGSARRKKTSTSQR